MHKHLFHARGRVLLCSGIGGAIRTYSMLLLVFSSAAPSVPYQTLVSPKLLIGQARNLKGKFLSNPGPEMVPGTPGSDLEQNTFFNFKNKSLSEAVYHTAHRSHIVMNS